MTKFEELTGFYTGTKAYEGECVKRLGAVVRQVIKYTEWPVEQQTNRIDFVRLNDMSDKERSIGDYDRFAIDAEGVVRGSLEVQLAADDPQAYFRFKVTACMRRDGVWVAVFGDSYGEMGTDEGFTMDSAFLEKAYISMKRQVSSRFIITRPSSG